MLKEVKNPVLVSERLTKPPFAGAQKKCGELKVEVMKLDKQDKHRMFLRIKGRSCHQLFRLYGFLFDTWVKTGFAFDEYTLIKEGRSYYAEISYTDVKDARLRVSVITNNREVTGYDNEKDNENYTPLFGHKRGAGLQEKEH